jgi:hypothetical protein
LRRSLTSIVGHRTIGSKAPSLHTTVDSFQSSITVKYPPSRFITLVVKRQVVTDDTVGGYNFPLAALFLTWPSPSVILTVKYFEVVNCVHSLQQQQRVKIQLHQYKVKGVCIFERKGCHAELITYQQRNKTFWAWICFHSALNIRWVVALPSQLM